MSDQAIGKSKPTRIHFLILFFVFTILPFLFFLHFHPERAFDSVFGPGDDGKPTTIYKTDVTSRGILIPGSGAHSILFEYRPHSIYLGLLITLLSAFAAIFLSIILKQ
jgi:hypothetical protein